MDRDSVPDNRRQVSLNEKREREEKWWIIANYWLVVQKRMSNLRFSISINNVADIVSNKGLLKILLPQSFEVHSGASLTQQTIENNRTGEKKPSGPNFATYRVQCTLSATCQLSNSWFRKTLQSMVSICCSSEWVNGQEKGEGEKRIRAETGRCSNFDPNSPFWKRWLRSEREREKIE